MKTLLGYNLTSVNMTPRERKRIRHPCRVDGWYSCFAAAADWGLSVHYTGINF